MYVVCSNVVATLSRDESLGVATTKFYVRTTVNYVKRRTPLIFVSYDVLTTQSKQYQDIKC